MLEKIKYLFNYDNSAKDECNRINVMMRALCLVNILYSICILFNMFTSFSYSDYKYYLLILPVYYIFVIFMTYKFPGKPALACYCVAVGFMNLWLVYLFGNRPGFHYNTLILTLVVYYEPLKHKFQKFLFGTIIDLYALIAWTVFEHLGSKLVLSYEDLSMLSTITIILVAVSVSIIAAYYYKKFAVNEESIMAYANELETFANEDALTILYNRRGFTIHCWELEYSTVAAAIMDIDDFKHVNDNYGHDIGDEVLRHLGSILLKYSRQYGLVTSRWGGEEFVVLYDQVTYKKPFVELLNEIRQDILDDVVVVTNDKFVKYHVTMGVAYNEEAHNYEDLVGVADTRLYYGKTHGKNVIIDRNYD